MHCTLLEDVLLVHHLFQSLVTGCLKVRARRMRDSERRSAIGTSYWQNWVFPGSCPLASVCTSLGGVTDESPDQCRVQPKSATDLHAPSCPENRVDQIVLIVMKCCSTERTCRGDLVDATAPGSLKRCADIISQSSHSAQCALHSRVLCSVGEWILCSR